MVPEVFASRSACAKEGVAVSCAVHGSALMELVLGLEVVSGLSVKRLWEGQLSVERLYWWLVVTVTMARSFAGAVW